MHMEAMKLSASESCAALLRKWEGLRLAAYRCSSGVWTIGYGHTGADVGPEMRISRSRAEQLLREDMARAARALPSEVLLTQGAVDALTSLIFNIGQRQFEKSRLRRMVVANPEDPAIRGEFLRWVHGGGKVLPGLVARRREEAALYFS
jgi:lysozyme